MIRRLRAALLGAWLVVAETDTLIGLLLEGLVFGVGLALLVVAIGGGL